MTAGQTLSDIDVIRWSDEFHAQLLPLSGDHTASHHVLASSELEIFPYHHIRAQDGGVLHGTACSLLSGAWWVLSIYVQAVGR